jgi:hypothetical protein
MSTLAQNVIERFCIVQRRDSRTQTSLTRQNNTQISKEVTTKHTRGQMNSRAGLYRHSTSKILLEKYRLVMHKRPSDSLTYSCEIGCRIEVPARLELLPTVARRTGGLALLTRPGEQLISDDLSVLHGD